jgi:hypothetical protein
MTSTTETGTVPAAVAEEPKATKKARVAPQSAKVAKKKAKSAKKATPSNKAPKGAKKAKGPREGSKTNQILDLLNFNHPARGGLPGADFL